LRELVAKKLQPSLGRKIHLNSRPRAAFFVLVIGLPALAFAALTLRITLAESWGKTEDLQRMQRALALDSSNPELHRTLGLLYLWGQSGTATQAVQELHKAVELNPYSATCWSGLSKACYAAGDQACAGQAVLRAMELTPSKPQYAWEAVLHQVNAGRRSEAVSASARFLRLQPVRAGEVFQLLQRGFEDLEFIWNELVSTSGNIQTMLAYLDFLSQKGNFELAERCWQQIISSRPPASFTAVQPYLERLLAAGHYAEAARVWRYLLRNGGVALPPDNDKDNLIFNGSFEQLPLNGGFDWRHSPQTYLEVDFANPSAHSGRRALQLQFTVLNNSDYEPVYQLVPVMPGQRYLLTAFVRSEEITSDSGPRLRVVDPNCPACLTVETEDTTGTSPWRQVWRTFQAGPETEVVRISIWRPRGRSFPMDITGRFWIDDVSLHPLRCVASNTPGPLPCNGN
jgi:tetratricopeptide (TPR) repeat protein